MCIFIFKSSNINCFYNKYNQIMSSPSIHNSKSKKNLVSNPSSATKVPAKSVEKNPTRKHQSENLTQVDPIKIDSDDVKEVQDKKRTRSSKSIKNKSLSKNERNSNAEKVEESPKKSAKKSEGPKVERKLIAEGEEWVESKKKSTQIPIIDLEHENKNKNKTMKEKSSIKRNKSGNSTRLRSKSGKKKNAQKKDEAQVIYSDEDEVVEKSNKKREKSVGRPKKNLKRTEPESVARKKQSIVVNLEEGKQEQASRTSPQKMSRKKSSRKSKK